MSTSEPKRVLLLGDAMVDAYLESSPVGISDEAPVAVLDFKAIHRMLGGMLNVAYSLRQAGLAVHVAGLIGDDEAGMYLREETQRLGITADWFTDGRPTTEKTRVTAGPDFLARLDWERTTPVDITLRGQIDRRLATLIDQCDIVVISDYAKGFMDKTTARLIVERCQKNNCRLIVDAKPTSFAWYRGATLFTPNHREAIAYAEEMDPGISPEDGHRMLSDKEAAQLGGILAEDLQGQVLLTRGEAGMTLIPTDGSAAVHIEAEAETVVSTSGAGDVVLAVVTASLLAGSTLAEATQRASEIVSRVVARSGTCRLEAGDLSH